MLLKAETAACGQRKSTYNTTDHLWLLLYRSFHAAVSARHRSNETTANNSTASCLVPGTPTAVSRFPGVSSHLMVRLQVQRKSGFDTTSVVYSYQ